MILIYQQEKRALLEKRFGKNDCFRRTNYILVNLGMFEGLKILRTKKFFDKRGYFKVLYNKQEFDDFTDSENLFMQDNISLSHRNVLRGLHFQYKNSQGKLLQVLSGSIFDVVVDLRSNSKSFKKSKIFHLSEDDDISIWIPKGFAHGFKVLSEQALVLYKVDAKWDESSEKTLHWDDPKLNIPWPNPSKIVTSAKDKNGLSLDDAIKLMEITQ